MTNHLTVLTNKQCRQQLWGFFFNVRIVYYISYAPPLQKYWYYYYFVLWSDLRWLVEMNIHVLALTTFWKYYHVLCYLKMYCVHRFPSVLHLPILTWVWDMYQEHVVSCFVKKNFFFLIYRSSNFTNTCV